MNEELVKKLEKLGLTPGSALTRAKRKYRDAKVIKTYSNEIRKDEQKYFKNDEYLIGLIAEQERISAEIVEHIDTVLATARENPQPTESLQEKVRRDVEERMVD